MSPLNAISLPMAVRAAYLHMHRQAEALLRPVDLTANQFVILWVLSKQETTQNALAELVASDRNTIRPVLLALEKKKWIRRVANPADARSLVVQLTAAGKRKYAQVEQLGASFRSELEALFSPKELQQFQSFLDRVQSHFAQ